MSRFVLTAQLQLQAPTNTRQVMSQIRSQLQGLNVPVTVTGAKQAQSQIQGVTNATNQATTAAQRMGGAFGVAVKRFLAFSIAARGISFVTMGISNATKEAISFQREMIKISQVTGKAVSDLQGLENTITRLATTLGVSSKELLGTSRILAQAGIQARSLDIALEALAKTTLAPTFEDITKTAEGAVAILAQFQRGVGALEEQLGAINAVAGQFAVESGDLIAAIRRTGGVFKAAGGDLNELLGLFTAIRATTRESAESIATGLRTILTRIQRPSTIKYLENLGISLTDLEGRFVGPFEAIRRLSKALSGLEEGDLKFVEIAEQLGGFRQIGKVIPLLQQFETAEKARQAALEGGDSLTKDAASAQAALAVQIAKVKEEFLALVRGFANTTSFQAFVKTALSLASALIKVADSIKPILPLLATLGTMAALRGLGGFARGIGGGLTRNHGGKVHGFARGGVVPGTGNRDTVPAMLQPGEFVIRKSSVDKLGTGTLQAMNQNKMNLGGALMQRSALRRAGGSPGAAAKAGKGYKGSIDGATFQVIDQMDQQAMARINASSNVYGGVFLRPEGRGQTVGINIPQGYIRKEVETSPGYLTMQQLAKAGANTPALAALKKEASAIAARAGGKEGQAKLVAGSLSKPRAELMEDTILNGVRNVIQNTTKQIGGQIGSRTPPDQMKIMKTSNIDNVVGNIFEAALIAAGSPYEDGRTLSNAAFDFPIGLRNLAATFGLTSVMGRPTDAKSTFNQGNLKSFDKKIVNYEVQQLSKDIDAALQPLAAQMAAAGGATRTGAGSIGLLTKGGKFGTGQAAAAGSLMKFKASGGTISGKDTVPALLTPGEFVVNKKAAQSIGYGNLSRMNTRGVAKFNAGGPVGVQRFANGGKMSAGSVSFKGLDTITSKSMALGSALDKMGASVPKINMVLERFRTALAGGATNAQAMQVAFKGTNVAATGSTVAINKSAASEIKNASATDKNTMAKMKETKSSGGMMMGIMSLTMMLGMFAPTIDENSSAMTKATGELIQMLMTLGMVIMALDMFGIKLSAQTLLGGRGVGSGVAGRVTGALGGGKLAGGVGKVAGLFTKLLGPMALAIGAFYAITKIMDIYSGVHEKAKKAVEEGDVENAGQAALDSANQKAANKIVMGAAAAGAAIGTAFGPVGTVVGGLIGGLVGLTAKTEMGQKAIDNLRNSAVGLFIGMDSSDTVRKQAEADAALNRYTKNLDKNNKATDEVFKDLQSGVISLDQAMRDASLNQNLRNAQDALARARAAEQARADQGFSYGREFMSFFGIMDSNQAQMDQARAKVEEAQETLDQAIGDRRAKAERLLPQFAKENLGQGTFDEFLAAQELTRADFTSDKKGQEQLKLLEQRFKNLNEETRKQIEAVKALNFGLRGVRATSSVLLQSLSDVDKRAETGANKFLMAADTLSLGITEAASKLDPQKFSQALDDLGESMSDMGASPEEVTKAKQTLKDLNTVQRGAAGALEKVKKDLEQGGNEADIKKALEDNLLDLLPPGNKTREILRKQLASMDLDDAAMTALRKGDYDEFLKTALGDAFGEAGEQIIELAKARGEAEQDLIKTIYDRRKAEDEFIKAQQAAIDVQIEAAKIIAEFGGPQFTPEQQNLANINKFNLAANQAGVGGLRSGNAADITRVSQGIANAFATQERTQQAAFRGDGPGFQGADGADADNRKRLLETNKQLLSYAKQRIQGYKEELEIVRAKNKAEKDALDKLISGDVEGFIKGQLAASAGAALRTGDRGLANLFSAGTLGAGFKTLEGQKLDDQTRRRAASLTLGAVGINDQRSAGVLAGATAEEENIKGLIRETATAMARVADNFADMKELEVETQNVRIEAKRVVFAEAGRAFQNAVNNPGVPGLRRGGMIYASAGMFVPRGTDTVPAMLTPGEFVVNRNAVSRGNNLQILTAMNDGVATASSDGYNNRGGRRRAGFSGPSMPNLEGFTKALTDFNSALAENIARLENTKFIVKLDPTNINVNLNGGSFLAGLSDSVKQELLTHVGQQIGQFKPNESGDLQYSEGLLA